MNEAEQMLPARIPNGTYRIRAKVVVDDGVGV